MDSEHRHELQKNDLEDFLLHWRQFWDKYGTHLLLVILIVLAIVVGYRWYSGREHGRNEAAYGELLDASSPSSKQDVAVKYDHVFGLPEVARLDAADMLLVQGIFGDLSDPNAPAPTPMQSREKLNDAIKIYQRVVESNGPKLAVANAYFGLAAAHESLGEFDAATKDYEAVEKLTAESFPHVAAQAKQLRESIGEIRKPVSFAESTSLLPGTGDALPPGVTPAPLGPESLVPPEFVAPPKPDAPKADPPTDAPKTEGGEKTEPAPEPGQ